MLTYAINVVDGPLCTEVSFTTKSDKLLSVDDLLTRLGGHVIVVIGTNDSRDNVSDLVRKIAAKKQVHTIDVYLCFDDLWPEYGVFLRRHRVVSLYRSKSGFFRCKLDLNVDALTMSLVTLVCSSVSTGKREITSPADGELPLFS